MPSDFVRVSHPDPYLDFPEETSPEELESQVQKAKAELETLRERQNQIEREKQRLEELSRRQEELAGGRTEMVNKFTRALGIIDSESEDTMRRLQQLNDVQRSFKEYLRELENINPRMWSSSEISKELSKGLVLVENARSEYFKVQSKFSDELSDDRSLANYEEGDDGVRRDFFYWLKSGFAFTLPLLLFGVIGLILVLWLWGSHH